MRRATATAVVVIGGILWVIGKISGPRPLADVSHLDVASVVREARAVHQVHNLTNEERTMNGQIKELSATDTFTYGSRDKLRSKPHSEAYYVRFRARLDELLSMALVDDCGISYQAGRCSVDDLESKVKYARANDCTTILHRLRPRVFGQVSAIPGGHQGDFTVMICKISGNDISATIGPIATEPRSLAVWRDGPRVELPHDARTHQ